MPRTYTIADVPVVVSPSKRARRMSLVAHPQTFRVVKPRHVTYREIESFLKSREAWIAQQARTLQRSRAVVIDDVPERELSVLRADARMLVSRLVEEVNQVYGFQYSRITTKNTKSQWGSCSRRGALSFSYKILFLPESLQRYVVTHEVCHLQVFDHSPRFWRVVAQTLPNYRALERDLRRYYLR